MLWALPCSSDVNGRTDLNRQKELMLTSELDCMSASECNILREKPSVLIIFQNSNTYLRPYWLMLLSFLRVPFLS